MAFLRASWSFVRSSISAIIASISRFPLMRNCTSCHAKFSPTPLMKPGRVFSVRP